MINILVGFLLLLGVTCFACYQLFRAWRTGGITAHKLIRLSGVVPAKYIRIPYQRRNDPGGFFFTVAVYALISFATFFLFIQLYVRQYVFGETAPTNADVQQERYDSLSLLVSWNRPERLDYPDEYVVYRSTALDSTAVRIVTTTIETRFVDEEVQEGASYTYQIEAKYSGLTNWLVAGESTISEPVCGTQSSL
jgi:hypothetical protein